MMRKPAGRIVGLALTGGLFLAGMGCQNQVTTGTRTLPTASPAAAASPVTVASPATSTSAQLTAATGAFGSTVTDAMSKAQSRVANNPTAKAVVDSAVQTMQSIAAFTGGAFTTQATKTYTTTLPTGGTLTTTFVTTETDPENWTISLQGTTIVTGKVAKSRQSGYITLLGSGFAILVGLPAEQGAGKDATLSWQVSGTTVTMSAYNGTSPTGTPAGSLTVNTADGSGSFTTPQGSGSF